MKINELENFLRTGQIGAHSSYKWGTPGRDGKRYNWHQFGQQLIVLPLYLTMRITGYSYYSVNIISTALTAIIILRILLLLGFTLRPSLLTSLTFGLATLAWHYASKTPHEHALTIIFLMSGIYYAMKYQMGFGKKNLIFSMVSIGFAYTVRFDGILAVLPVSAYLFLGREENAEKKFSLLNASIVSAVFLVPFVLSQMVVSYIKFGSFLSGGYYAELFGVEKLFSIRYFPIGLIGALLSPGRSIFLFSPVLLLFPFYIKAFKDRVDRHFFILFVSFIAMYFLFYCFYYDFGGDWCFGPRYFLNIGPFMVMPLSVMFEKFRKAPSLKKAAIAAVLAFSVVTQVVFVTSNTYLSNVIKYGIDDDTQPELTRKYNRVKEAGPPGTWKRLASYFLIKDSQFLNQFKLFRYTMLISADSRNMSKVAWEIKRSHAPYLIVYLNLMREFDVWWLQQMSALRADVAAIPTAIGIAALFLIVRFSRKELKTGKAIMSKKRGPS